ncbi:hypothetical protein KDM41_16420, partial [bacterium]|nr:hypothetical protein [bacterium]
MSDTKINYWKDVDGGFRGSLLLRAGAVTVALGAVLNLAALLVGGGPESPSPSVTTVAWLVYIAALWLLGAGFVWVGANPFLTRFGFVVGALNFLQGGLLLVLLFTNRGAMLPPVSLTVGRLLATLIFAIVEREHLARRVWRTVAVVAALSLVKTVLRIVGWWPDLGLLLGQLVDAVFLLALAAAMLQLALSIRGEEDRWARQIYETSSADFGEFNNPEHAWNKPEP